jgi:small GTP-binding protein
MADLFKYDAFLSHSSKDKLIVRQIAERLKKDGVKVWFDEWNIEVGDSILGKIEEGLDQSRILILFMSENALGSEWSKLESGTFRFRDPNNQERRFIPVRLDKVKITESLAQFLFLDWSSDTNEAYNKLLETCKASVEYHEQIPDLEDIPVSLPVQATKLKGGQLLDIEFSKDCSYVIASTVDQQVILSETKNGRYVRPMKTDARYQFKFSGGFCKVSFSPDGDQILTVTDNKIQLWHKNTGLLSYNVKTFYDHESEPTWDTSTVRAVAWNTKRNEIYVGSNKTFAGWHTITKGQLFSMQFPSGVKSLAVSSSADFVVVGDGSGAIYKVRNTQIERIFEGHTAAVRVLTIDRTGKILISGSADNTISLWHLDTGERFATMVGHTKSVASLAVHPNKNLLLAGSVDYSISLWNFGLSKCLCILKGHEAPVASVGWSKDGKYGYSADKLGYIYKWDLSGFITSDNDISPIVINVPLEDQVQYTNAKVLIVGESGSGKTGLAIRIALNRFQPTDSTIGAWATQWKLPVKSSDKVEKEVWLWDFGGQADQRLIHQLFMQETALAVLVFDPQKDDAFENLNHWNRDLSRAGNSELSKLLVAGRVDAGGLRSLSKKDIENFTRENGFSDYIETSAKTGQNCEKLKKTIVSNIKWDKIPWRSSPRLFKRLKDEIVAIKDAGKVLIRFNELREMLSLKLSGDDAKFTDDELKAVVTLLTGPGVVWQLNFGSWILLQPERLNFYAQAVIRTLREDEGERGSILEQRVLDGQLLFNSEADRLTNEDERFVLLEMHKMLLERGLCLRQSSDTGSLLIFPSYYRRERPELEGHPSVLVSYRFKGFLDEIYATLVVRLHHTKSFKQDTLWKYAADFKTLTGRQLGIKMTRRSSKEAQLVVYFDPTIEMGEKIIFSKYVHEHLLEFGKDVQRFRHYVCPNCNTPVENTEVPMRKLQKGIKTIPCIECEKRILLWDELEQQFASKEIQETVRDLRKKSEIVLDNESKERALVGEVMSTVALAGQISREFSVSDHGIDMEIEFKDDEGRATGKKLYLQLKSGDSYLHFSKGTGRSIFTIKKPRHVEYWASQAFPVMIVVRNSSGSIQWMEVRETLRALPMPSLQLNKTRTIDFVGEKFDVMSVRKWREKILASTHV